MTVSQARKIEGSLSNRAHERIIKRVFLTPGVAFLLAFSIFPLLWSLSISFTDYQRGGSGAAQNESVASEEGISLGFLGLGINVTLRNYGW
jgi:ABC-type sugar transport system permease subunit